MADQRDFVRAYDEHAWRIYGYLAYRLRSRSEAEDLTQVTFERALRAWGSFDPGRAPAGAWLFAIARNVYAEHRRHKGTGVKKVPLAGRAGEAIAGVEPGPEQQLGLDPGIAAAIGALRRREREAIALRFGGDLRIREVADAMGLTVANAQQILSRALRRLRSILEPKGYGANGPAPTTTPRAAALSRDKPQAR